MNDLDYTLSEIKTLVRILSTWGNTLVPDFDGKDTTAQERLEFFVNKATSEFGMTLEEIEQSIE